MKKALRRAGLGILILIGLFILVQAWFFAQILWWKNNDPADSRFMRQRLVEMRKTDPKAELRHQWVDYERISPHLKRAVVAAEDDHFMSHRGFDWTGIQRAMERNQQRGSAAAGGSTITQQLAKNLFLSPSRSYLRKGQEALITVMLETTWDKRRILEVYLNVAEWGDGVFGAEAAARHHFGISAARLGPVEASRLAVMLPSPRRYERQFGPRLTAQAERLRLRMRHTSIP